MRRKRREMTADTVDAFSEAIKEGLFSLQCMKKAGTVCTFLSAFKEPDTIRIVTALRKNGCRIIVPISHTDTNTLSLSYIDGIEDLHKGAYGILEPNVVGEADSDEIDVILVPGLAFDREGGRMGFGKGYYDRLLEKSTAVKIGLCYDFQLFDKIPKEKHDVPMDYIITEKEICERSLD
jgi:5-formyltetrahydrofolate cyclo-ligase